MDVMVGLEVGKLEVTAAGYHRLLARMEPCADGVRLSNVNALQWQHATADWGLVDTVSFFDTRLAGTRLGQLLVTDPIDVVMYDIVRIPAFGIVLRDANSFGAMPVGWGMGGFGMEGFATTGDISGSTVILELGFDQQHVCEPGAWVPGPFALAS